MLLAISLAGLSCSKSAVSEASPEERIRDARTDLGKRRYQKAYENLEELRTVTAGTRLGGEVQFLLGEAAFRSGKYPEAESHYAAYLNAYPEGPFTEKALYMQARAKVNQLLKRSYLTFKSYIPYDRDVSLLREARVLFEIYVEKYPEGEWIDVATRRAGELLAKEGRHELEIASFYLKRNSPRPAAARARAILEEKYPEDIKARARELIRQAEESMPMEPGGSSL